MVFPFRMQNNCSYHLFLAHKCGSGRIVFPQVIVVKPSIQTLFSVLIVSFRQLKEFYNVPVL